MPAYDASYGSGNEDVALTNKCIVLDLDETLVYTAEDFDDLAALGIMKDPTLAGLRKRTYRLALDDIGEKRGAGVRYDLWGITRPWVKDFLVFCFSYFKIVAVWTAGQKSYADEIVDFLFRDIRPPHAVFSRDEIVEIDGSGTKPLTKLIKSTPVLRRHMALTNTFSLDDNAYTYERVNPGNGVLIPHYSPPPNISALTADETSLLQLKYWLLQPNVMNASDVRLLDKEHIFTTPLSAYAKIAAEAPAPKFS